MVNHGFIFFILTFNKEEIGEVIFWMESDGEFINFGSIEGYRFFILQISKDLFQEEWNFSSDNWCRCWQDHNRCQWVHSLWKLDCEQFEKYDKQTTKICQEQYYSWQNLPSWVENVLPIQIWIYMAMIWQLEISGLWQLMHATKRVLFVMGLNDLEILWKS